MVSTRVLHIQHVLLGFRWLAVVIFLTLATIIFLLF